MIEVLKGYEIPVDSYVRAVQVVNGDKKLNNEEAGRRLVELLGEEADLSGITDPRKGYLHLVEAIVKNEMIGEAHRLSAEQMLNNVVELVKVKEEVVKEKKVRRNLKPASTTPEKKGTKGVKKAKALKMWQDGGKGDRKPDSRKEWIELFMDEADLTKQGASTYHYNFKKGLWK